MRRVGRNLVIFQQIEYFLKLLLAYRKNAGPVDRFPKNFQVNAACIDKKTLGHLVERYATEILCDAGGDVSEEEGPSDWLAFSFHISGETDFIEGLRSDLQVMTDERNELVHHFLPRLQPCNDEALTEALMYLDAQRERVLPMHEHLRSTAQRFSESAGMLAEFVASPEFKKQTKLFWLQASPLVTFLCEVAAQYHRQDGWTYLAQAGRLATRELPNEVKRLGDCYGFKTLKQLLIGAEYFDVLDEPLPRGGFRTLYRRKDEA